MYRSIINKPLNLIVKVKGRYMPLVSNVYDNPYDIY